MSQVEEVVPAAGPEEGDEGPLAEVKQEMEDDVSDEDYGFEEVRLAFEEAPVKKVGDDNDDQVSQEVGQDKNAGVVGVEAEVPGKRKRKPRKIFNYESDDDDKKECSKSKKKSQMVPPVPEVPRVKCELCKRKMKSTYLPQHNRKFHKEEYIKEIEKRREEQLKLRKARLLNPESTTKEAILKEMEKRRWNSLQRQGLTEKEWEDILERKRFQKLEKILQMSEEEKWKKRMEGYLRYQSWKAKFTKEEWLEMRRLEGKRRRGNLSEEKRREILKRNRERIKRLSGDKLERHKDIFRRGTKKYLERMRREEPDKYFEKVTVYSRRRYGEVASKMLGYQRERVKNEGVEERERRLMRYRVAQAKRKVRREMEVEGGRWSKEEIEVKLREVEEQVKRMGGGGRPSKYKPRMGARKPKNMKNRKTSLPIHYTENCGGGGDGGGGGVEVGDSEACTSGLENVTTAPPVVHQPYTVIPLEITHIINEGSGEGEGAVEVGLGTIENFGVTSVTTCAKVPVIQYVKQIEIEFEGGEGECSKIIPISTSDDAHHFPIFYDFYQDVGPLASLSEDQVQFVNVSSTISIIRESAEEMESIPQMVTQQVPPDNIVVEVEEEDPQISNSLFVSEEEPEVELELEEPGTPPPPEPSEPPTPPPQENVVTTTLEPQLSTTTSGAPRPEMCDECGKTFKTKGNLMEHKSLLHFMDPSKLTCPKCSRPCPNTRVLWNHFVTCRNSADGTNFSKQVIPKVGEEEDTSPSPPSSLGDGGDPNTDTGPPKKKVNTNRGNKFPNICDQCGKIFRQKCTLDDHLRRAHQGKGHICSVCGRDQQSAAKLWRHQKERHSMKDIPPPEGLPREICKYCGEVIMRGYEQHVQKHHVDKFVEFREWYDKVKKDKRKREQNNPQICEFCKGTYPNKRQLRRHVRHMHLEGGGGVGGCGGGGGGGMHRCPDCGKDFKRKNHLSRHSREIHGVEKIEVKLEAENLIKICNRFKSLAVCLLCGGGGGGEVQLPGRNSIRAHFVSEHYQIFQEIEFDKIKVYCCEICEERFEKEIGLREHLEGRHKEVEYKCKYCGIFKLSQQQLMVHQKNVHLEEMGRVRGRMRGRRKNMGEGDGDGGGGGGISSKKKGIIGRGRGRPTKKLKKEIDEKIWNKFDKKLVIKLVRLEDDKN